jgi:gamma-glutamylcyclotransferase (GGCT)/AIG2-like uncharacterized protein YtfP
MNPHLFVYGSLLSKAGHPMGARLAREARCLGEGSLPGRLYRIAWYPGLVEAAVEGARVCGEVYALTNPVPTLHWLDAYEGLTVDGPHQGEYARRERPVLLAGGAEVSCWVYLYCRDASGLAALPDGRWLDGAAPACNRSPPRHNS